MACYKLITWIITYDFMSDYIHFTSLSCNYMPPSVVFHDVSKAARPAQILVCVNLVIVVAPAFINPSIDIGEWYRAVVRLGNLEFSVAEDPGRRLPQRALTFVLLFINVTVLQWGSGRRRVS